MHDDIGLPQLIYTGKFVMCQSSPMYGKKRGGINLAAGRR